MKGRMSDRADCQILHNLRIKSALSVTTNGRILKHSHWLYGKWFYEFPLQTQESAFSAGSTNMRWGACWFLPCWPCWKNLFLWTKQVCKIQFGQFCWPYHPIHVYQTGQVLLRCSSSSFTCSLKEIICKSIAVSGMGPTHWEENALLSVTNTWSHIWLFIIFTTSASSEIIYNL